MLKTREESREVLYVDEPLPLVSRHDIAVLEARVEEAPFKRTRLCVHHDPQDRLHEMFIVQSPRTYIRPHKHMDKAESLLVLDGAADAIFFDEAGAITSVVSLGDYRSGQPFFYRIGEALYHSLLIRTETFVFKEATHGPFDRTRTVFAPWAPDERDQAAADAYKLALIKQVRSVWVPS